MFLVYYNIYNIRNTHSASIFSSLEVASTNHARLDVVIYTAAGVVADKGHDDDLKDLRLGPYVVFQTTPATHSTFDVTSDVLSQRDWLHSGIVCREVRTHLQTMFQISHLILTMEEYNFKKISEK